MDWKSWGVAILAAIAAGIPLSVVLIWLFPRVALLLGIPLLGAADAPAVFLAYVLAVVTVAYVVLTGRISHASEDSAAASRDMATQTRESVHASREMVDRMADAIRPMLVPVVNFEEDQALRIEALGHLSEAFAMSSAAEDPLPMLQVNRLVVQNIGLGPALNIGIAIEAPLGEWSIPLTRAGTRPIPAGGKELAYQWKTGNAMQILEGSVLTITYDDMLGRHFQTTACRALHDWYNIDAKPDDTPAPPREYPRPIV